MLPMKLYEMLDATNDQGIMSFRCSFYEASPEKYKGLKGIALKRKIVERTLRYLDKFVNDDRFVSNSMLLRINPEIKIGDSEEEGVTFTFNACPILLLPGEDPVLEVKTLKSFYNEMKNALIDLHAMCPDYLRPLCFVIQTKHEDSIELHDTDELDSETRSKLEQYAKSFSEKVDNDPVLSAWRKNYGRMLSKIGPWSWDTFSDDNFFDQTESPIFLKRMRNQNVQARQNSMKL